MPSSWEKRQETVRLKRENQARREVPFIFSPGATALSWTRIWQVVGSRVGRQVHRSVYNQLEEETRVEAD